MKIGRSISTLIAAHSALKTGVHAVVEAFLAKTSQEDQSLSDAEIPAAIARDAEVTAAVAAEATARDAAIATHAELPNAHHTIASGTYTGDGTDDRQITTGFKCSLVIVFCPGGTKILAVILPDGGAGVTTSAMALAGGSALHATDGFIVFQTGDILNEDTIVCPYWAISE